MTSRTARVAAIACALGAAAAFAVPATASAQSSQLGSLMQDINTQALTGSIMNTVNNPEQGTGSAASLANVISAGSLQTSLGSIGNLPGAASLGNLGGLLNEQGYNDLAGSLQGSLSGTSDNTGSMSGMITSDSLGLVLNGAAAATK